MNAITFHVSLLSLNKKLGIGTEDNAKIFFGLHVKERYE